MKLTDILRSQCIPLSHRENYSNVTFFKEPRKTCRWQFLNYTPSSWENVWYNSIDVFQTNVCERLASSEYLNRTIAVVERVVELQKFGRNKTMGEKQNSDTLLSRMFYREECINPHTNIAFSSSEVSHLIEPLIGLLRDPFTICPRLNASLVPPSVYDGAILQSKRFNLLSISAPFYRYSLQQDSKNLNSIQNHIIDNSESVLPWMYQRSMFTQLKDNIKVKNPNAILIDLGSSYFGGWNGDTTAAAGFWFYEYYKRFNVKFDRIIAFEHSLLDQKAAWDQLPDDVFSIYTVINTGVTESGKLNPWTMLRTIVQPSDHVVVKIDIDTPGLENTLINQILNDPSIHSLIDELFFEHHITVNEMIPYWGRPPGVLKDSYILFRKLRQLGIRMHSWP